MFGLPKSGWVDWGGFILSDASQMRVCARWRS